jgi:hypothetical protein
MATHHGSCLCGSVRFAAELAKPEMHCCHCSLCRRWGGGPAFGVDLAGPPRFEDTRTLKAYRSSDWAERLFCATCGTSVLWRSTDGHFHVVPVALLGDPAELGLAVEIFIDDKPGYYALAGTRPCLTGAETMALFAGEAGAGETEPEP